MDNLWRTSAWNWGEENKDDRVPLFRCHPGREACVVQITRKTGSPTPDFDQSIHSRSIETQEEWDKWLDEIPQPHSDNIEGSLSLVVCRRHPDTKTAGGTLRNPLNLTHVPVPGGRVFRRLIETFHIHQATQTIMNRGWPIILRSEDLSGPDRKIYYNLRTTNTLENDTALSLTTIPSKSLTYAIFFGYTPLQITTVLSRLSLSSHAALEPFTLINAFIQLEKVHRFEQVERHADEMTDLIKNFQIDAAAAATSARVQDPVPEDDPRDLVGLAAKMTMVRNGLVSWAKELERFRARVGGEFGREMVLRVAAAQHGGGGEGEVRMPLLDAGEYLDRTVDEYAAMVRRCEGMLEQVSMTFQMETSSIARQEVNKMKALAILTMVFLPATFVATFMSMGLFNWHATGDEKILAPLWWIYFAVAGGLTALVFIVYLFWSRLADAWSLRGEKSDRHIV